MIKKIKEEFDVNQISNRRENDGDIYYSYSIVDDIIRKKTVVY
ncbi:hypothetical protein RyT2_25350 [Pseudolactococcus yaeyamensis]